MKELPKVYDPRDVESRIYKLWMDGDCFKAEPNPDKKPFSIVMPPPNVTGQLHMGHAMDCTLQDILIRYKRMQGYEALWLPGSDHAGIATQIKVEEELRKNEGLTRYDLGREKFLERVWAWKEKYGSRIVEQQKKMGASCDWSRDRFTMDEGCSRAVRETFCELYEKGLIYKGSRIINWCPHCLTALSDAEVEYTDKPGNLWYIRYPLADGSGDIVIATTRPETMFGDTGVAAAGQPQCLVALHPLKAGQDVLQGAVQGVAHVELAGDVGGRHDDGERLLLRVLHALEAVMILPHLIDAGLHLLGLIHLGEFFVHVDSPI